MEVKNTPKLSADDDAVVFVNTDGTVVIPASILGQIDGHAGDRLYVGYEGSGCIMVHKVAQSSCERCGSAQDARYIDSICAELCRKCAYDLSTHFDRLKPADYVCECCGSSTGVRQIDGLYINICELCKVKLTETF